MAFTLQQLFENQFTTIKKNSKFNSLELEKYIDEMMKHELISLRDDKLIELDMYLKGLVWSHFIKFHKKDKFTYQSYFERSESEELTWFEDKMTINKELYEEWWKKTIIPMIGNKEYKSSYRDLKKYFDRFQSEGDKIK